MSLWITLLACKCARPWKQTIELIDTSAKAIYAQRTISVTVFVVLFSCPFTIKISSAALSSIQPEARRERQRLLKRKPYPEYFSTNVSDPLFLQRVSFRRFDQVCDRACPTKFHDQLQNRNNWITSQKIAFGYKRGGLWKKLGFVKEQFHKRSSVEREMSHFWLRTQIQVSFKNFVSIWNYALVSSTFQRKPSDWRLQKLKKHKPIIGHPFLVDSFWWKHRSMWQCFCDANTERREQTCYQNSVQLLLFQHWKLSPRLFGRACNFWYRSRRKPIHKTFPPSSLKKWGLQDIMTHLLFSLLTHSTSP